MDDQAILQYAAAHWREMRVVGRGTHTSGILETPEGPVFVKRQALEDNALSPFWARMKRLFGWSFSGQRRCLEQTVRAMATPYIPAARDIGSVEEEKLCVFQVMPGNPWEPDRFPDKFRKMEKYYRMIAPLDRGYAKVDLRYDSQIVCSEKRNKA